MDTEVKVGKCGRGLKKGLKLFFCITGGWSEKKSSLRIHIFFLADIQGIVLLPCSMLNLGEQKVPGLKSIRACSY